MKCKNARLLISALLDGELNEREEGLLEQHLSTCAACRQENEAFAGLRGTMALWTDEEPSPWLAENFAYKLRRLQDEKETAKKGRPRWVFGTAAAGLATTLLAAAFLFTSQVDRDVPLPVQNPPVAVNTNPGPPPDDTQTRPEAPEVDTSDNASQHPEAGPAVTGGSDKRIVDQGKRYTGPGKRIRYIPVRRNYKPATAGMASAEQPGGGSGRVIHTIDMSRSRDMLEARAQEELVRKMAAARLTEDEVGDTVASNLGEAGLAMNETVEIVRGTLRKAADVLAAERRTSTNRDAGLEEGVAL